MSKIVSIKFNDDELSRLARAHAASEDVGLGTHIKRVYFDALRLNEAAIASMQRDLERVRAVVEGLRERESKADDDLLLTLLSGLYLMVWKSVPDNVRSQVDKSINVELVSDFLREIKR